MTINQLQVQEFMNFFSGSQHNFGEYSYSKEIDGNNKKKGRGVTITNKLITIKEYQNHLEGKKGLGVVPITEKNKCRFSAIDVDIYNKDMSPYIEAIERGGFPLVPFKSKSGGLHIYMFLKEEVSVKEIVNIMRRFSFLLSIDTLVRDSKKETVEIFPKQIKLEKGRVGNWINLPYYNSNKTFQYAIKNHKKLSLNEALLFIKDKQTTLSEAKEFLKDIQFSDAPPCLQMVYFLNPFDKGVGRNNFLFSFGVYLKKKDEDFFEQNLQEVNQSIKNPLPEKEIDRTILSSLRKRDYIYKCKESPCVDFCHKKECKKREYGIGKNEGYFSSVECGKLYQYKAFQPYYEWEVRLQGQENFKLLRFKSEDEIIKQDAFLRLCMRELHELPSKLKQVEWFNKVNQALKEINIVSIEKEDDTSPIMILRNFVLEFLTQRAMAETKDQIFAKRVFYDKNIQEYIFRTKDLIEYLYVQKQFKYFSPGELHGILREFKCVYKTVRTESRKQIRVASFSQKDLDTQEPKELFSPDFSQYSKEDF